MRALKYFINEAAESLLRSWRSAVLAILTIAAGLFVLGFFLMVNNNLQAVLDRWSQSAEMSVFLKDDITKEQVQAIDLAVAQSGLAAERTHLSKADAVGRFKEDFPDLAGAADRLQRNPFPASLEVRLAPSARENSAAVDALAGRVSTMPGVADVRYDRRWLSRLGSTVRFLRTVGLVIVGLLALAAALTVANVVRLAAYARRDEIEIMQLVGAPFAFIRGPFVAEGILQGGFGAVAALVSLWVVFLVGKAWYGRLALEGLGLTNLVFLTPSAALGILLGGMLLGCIGGLIVARTVR
ncbi:MAG TPA: ABC transporter permease [Vicinamibacterales bacterium]|nr:ABC transporter permease [Vicinamibacterales bacterium]